MIFLGLDPGASGGIAVMAPAAFVIDHAPMPANRLGRNWKYRYWQKKSWLKWIGEVAGPGPFGDGNAKLKTRVGISVYRRGSQDRDNMYASVKPLCDSLKKLGWIVDDSTAWCDLHVWEHKCAADEERTEFVIEFIQGGSQ